MRGANNSLSEAQAVVSGVAVVEEGAQVDDIVARRLVKVRFEAGFVLCGGQGMGS